MKGCPKNLLPVLCQANEKSWMTILLFKNWVLTSATPEIKSYSKKENLNLNALVLVDNALGDPVYVVDVSENAEFVLLRPHTRSIIQLMDFVTLESIFDLYIGC